MCGYVCVAATKLSGRTVLATIRNIVVHEYLRPEHEYVLWMDADVVKYPSDLIQRMYESNPHGVTAPLVVIESSDEDWYHHQLCGKAVCPHGTICGRPQCPRAKSVQWRNLPVRVLRFMGLFLTDGL